MKLDISDMKTFYSLDVKATIIVEIEVP